MLNEKDVENYWRSELSKLFPKCTISSPFKSDGVLELNELKILLEFKYDLDFSRKDNQVIVLIQAIYYLKMFELKGIKLPSLILIADKNECFVVHTNNVIKYLSEEIDWTIPPSEAYRVNQDLRLKLNETEFDFFVFNLSDKDVFNNIKTKILDLQNNTVRKIKATSVNIENIYKYFTERLTNKLNLSTNDLANLFIQIIINSDKNYLHPKKNNILITEAYGEIKIDSKAFINFFRHFEGDLYTNKEKKELTNCIDRLIEDSVRRKKGEFYTPKVWVDKAHSYIEDVFGENWKEEYIVWDNSCGQANLTKDYRFNSLIQTTIEESDIETLKQGNINPNSLKLKLDFLNDDIPESIIDIIKNKKLIVFMNPPYKTAGNNKRDSESDEGVAESRTREDMIKEKWSGYGQLYAQFIYRSLKLKELYNCEVNLAVFAPPLYLSSSSFKKFRENMLNQVNYVNGFMFRASEFSGTASNWSIVFSIFKQK